MGEIVEETHSLKYNVIHVPASEKKDASIITDKEIPQYRKIKSIALKKKIPILGVCRGFQLIANFFKCKITLHIL